MNGQEKGSTRGRGSFCKGRRLDPQRVCSASAASGGLTRTVKGNKDRSLFFEGATGEERGDTENDTSSMRDSSEGGSQARLRSFQGTGILDMDFSEGH